MFRIPPGRCCGDAQAHAALFGELERIGQQILQDLLEPLGIGDNAAPKILVDGDVEGESSRIGFVTERPCHHFEQ